MIGGFQGACDEWEERLQMRGTHPIGWGPENPPVRQERILRGAFVRIDVSSLILLLPMTCTAAEHPHRIPHRGAPARAQDDDGECRRSEKVRRIDGDAGPSTEMGRAVLYLWLPAKAA